MNTVININYNDLIELIKEHGKLNFKGYKMDEINRLANEYKNNNNIVINDSKDLFKTIKKALTEDKKANGFDSHYYALRRYKENNMIASVLMEYGTSLLTN